MGKLKVTGKARRECTCDIMYILLNFKAWGKSAAQSIESSMAQCDLFLDILEKNGVDINCIHMSKHDVSEEMYDDKVEISASRRIELRMPFEMNALNRLSEIIKENEIEVDMDVSFKLSNMIELHNQLIKEAVLDSKEKAEMIAETMGQKVVGIAELNAGDTYHNYDSEERAYYDQFCHKIGETHSRSKSNRLQAPLITEYESVNVEWIIE